MLAHISKICQVSEQKWLVPQFISNKMVHRQMQSIIYKTLLGQASISQVVVQHGRYFWLDRTMWLPVALDLHVD
jgi:hypothetical protein